jgi:hypothetical protein
MEEKPNHTKRREGREWKVKWITPSTLIEIGPNISVITNNIKRWNSSVKTFNNKTQICSVHKSNI